MPDTIAPSLDSLLNSRTQSDVLRLHIASARLNELGRQCEIDAAVRRALPALVAWNSGGIQDMPLHILMDECTQCRSFVLQYVRDEFARRAGT